MAKIWFTDKSTKALKSTEAPQSDYWDESLPGFGIRVSKTRKTWFVFYRMGQIKRRLSLGTYPVISLAEARIKAKEAFHQIANGIDPSTQAKNERFAETFEQLAREYIVRHAKPNKKSWKGDEDTLKRDVIPFWGKYKAKDITRKDVLKLLDKKKETAPIQANRVLALVRKIFNFGIERSIVEMNPCHMVKRPTDERPREGERVLAFDEIRKVWDAIELQQPLVAGILKMRLLTAQRGNEIRSIEWSDLDFEANIWTLPGEKTKNKKQHLVPLSTQVIELIDSLKEFRNGSAYLFPSPKDNSKHINNIHKAIDRIKKLSGVDFVDRDLRRTVASHMTAHLGTARSDVSKILNHTEGGITRIYDRYSYQKEKRAILQSWADLLDKIISGQKIQNQVITLHPHRGEITIIN